MRFTAPFAVGFALLALSIAFAQGLPGRPIPQGAVALPVGGSGRALAVQLSGSPSATRMFQALMIGFRGYFDATPRVMNAYRDARDTQLQASFSSSLQGVPVAGLIGVATQGSNARAVILFDRTRALPGSIDGLVRAATASGGGSSASANVPLTRTPLLDNSGAIGLAPGWRITGSYKGTVDILGPEGTQMALGGYFNVTTTQAQAAGMFRGMAAVSSTDPARGLVEISQQMARAKGQRLDLRIIDQRPVPGWQGGNAAFVRYRAVIDGAAWDAFGLFSIQFYDTNAALFYLSYVSAPSTVFRNILPTALRMWGTWSINPGVFTERLMKAAQSMRETGEIISSVNASRQRAFESINAGWGEYFRDVATLEDTGGNRAQVDQSFASNVVQNDPVNFRIVPPSELIPR